MPFSRGGTHLRDDKPGPPILTVEGGIDNRPMPVSVSLGDLNKWGFFWIKKNSDL